MATINISRQGHGVGPATSNFNTARTSAVSSVTDGVTGTNSVQYFHSGRGKRFLRAFL